MFKDGSTYSGEWYLGFACGYGKFTHAKGETYEGEFFDNMRHGKGLAVHQNCKRENGQWFKDKQDGVGVENWLDGSYFRGNYMDGEKKGFGL